nr:TRAP transporter permease [uncultured Dethiosulfovibrio sp.]
MKSLLDKYGPIRGRFLFLLLVFMSAYHLYSAGFGLLPTEIHHAIHLTFALVAVYIAFPLMGRPSWIDWPMAFLAGGVSGYIALFHDVIAQRGAMVQPYEIVLGVLMIVTVLEAGRRVAGRVLPFLGILFLVYALWGRYAPGIFMHRGFSLNRLIQQMYLTTEGIYGVAVGVSATYVFVFILFGSFLAAGGGIRLFNDLSMALAGSAPGGPAKVAVLASALLGTISGSSVGNVATTGAMTIPMMKRVGYEGRFAGAVEACASTGGQLMPPIMGAGAFVMTQFLGIPYLEIAKAAILPALLYYGAVLSNVHFRAKKKDLAGVDREEIPRSSDVLLRDGHLLLPIVVIIAMLLKNYTPLAAAFWGTVTVVLSASIRSHTRMSLGQILDAMADGAYNALSVAVACGVVGIVVGVATLTALGMTVSVNIMDLAGGNLFLTLLVAMVACLVMGMGLPTTANYIVTSTVIAPALMKLGVLPLAAHMFVFYFGIMADITPPVCLASFTAAGIAKSDPLRTGLTATSIGIVAYILPFAFVYDPIFLLRGEGIGFLPVFAVAVLGVISMASAIQGWAIDHIGPCSRVVSFLAGLVAFYPDDRARYVAASVILVVWGINGFKLFLKRDILAS